MTLEPSLSSLLRHASGLLGGIGAGNPRLEAEYLLSHAFGLERIELLRRGPREIIPEGVRARFDELLSRRLAREPLQYILGTVPFGELELLVGPGVLIPRSETEVLVERVARAAAAMPVGREAEEAPALRRLVDVGTGSGAILLALLDRLPGWTGTGIERSAGALAWARRNQRRTRSGGRATLVRGSLLDPVRSGTATIVVSNLPYIRTVDIPDLAVEIREHEPREALDGGEDGLRLVRPFLEDAIRVLRPGGLLALELAPDQPEVVRKWARASGAFADVVIYQDLADRPRGILARRV